ncbi:UNVERIFIED_ORG: phosphoribosyl-AMP cyclohydrolase [Arthrobacter sp. UYCu721]
MPARSLKRFRIIAVSAAALSLALSLAACAPSIDPPADPPSSAGAATVLPSAHIHGLSVNGETGQALLATHEGLFEVSKKPAVRVGPTNDLMGFTAALEQHVFYASGHPGPGSDLPNPLGLVKTSDGGATWEQLSRQGESDFHALTATKSGIVAFDGTLRTSPDGTSWKTAASSFTPAALAGNPYSDTVLATTAEGLQRSTDAGATWVLDKAAPVIQFAAFASATEAVGVEPGGAVHYSRDGGATWTRKGKISGTVQAVAATEGSDGNPWIWVVTSTEILVSTDGGATFRPSEAV